MIKKVIELLTEFHHHNYPVDGITLVNVLAIHGWEALPLARKITETLQGVDKSRMVILPTEAEIAKFLEGYMAIPPQGKDEERRELALIAAANLVQWLHYGYLGLRELRGWGNEEG